MEYYGCILSTDRIRYCQQKFGSVRKLFCKLWNSSKLGIIDVTIVYQKKGVLVIMEKIKNGIKPTFTIWILSVLCYLPMIAKGITNSVDGLWASTYFQSGNQELGSGRWALLFLDKFRGAYAAEPFSSLMALGCVAVAVYIAITMFTQKSVTTYMYAFLVTCSVTICCILSYRFTSLNYCLAILTAVLAVLLLTINTDVIKTKLLYLTGSISLLVLSIGIYQVSLGCFSMLVILYMMRLLYTEDYKNCTRLVLKALLVFFVSCIMYKIAWEVCLIARHTVASGYKGADSVSFANSIMGLPKAVGLIYFSWAKYFSYTRGNYLFSPIRVAITLIIFGLILFVGVSKLHKNPKAAIIYGMLWLLIPVAANIELLLVPGAKATELQMTTAMALALPLLLSLIENTAVVSKYLLGTIAAMLIYGNIYAVGTDIDAMTQGSISSNAIMSAMVGTLEEKQLLSGDYEYAFFGNISDNELFKTNELYDKANPYAKFGTLMTKPDMIHKAYIGLVDDLGLNLTIVDNDEYHDLFYSGVLEDMPSYPAKGSIIEKAGVIIIKVSDDYQWD